MKHLFFLILLFCHLPYVWGQTTISITYNGTAVPSQKIYIYNQGELIQNRYSSSSTGSAEFDALNSGVTYTYITETNHTGNISNGDKLPLICTKISIRLIDANSSPIISEYITIYENGDKIQSEYTDNDGYAVFYLNPSHKYAYSCIYGSGAVGTTVANQQKDIVVNCNILEIVPKYGDIPIPGNYYLYNIGNISDYIGYKIISQNQNGIIKFPVTENGQYVIKNQFGIYSNEIAFSKSSDRYYWEHYKVTFVSNNTNPNILQDLKVCGISGETKISDGKGYIVYYLPPGIYTYTHLTGSGAFTVTDSDQIIDLTTTEIKLIFQSTTKFAGEQFTVIDNNGNSTTYTTDDNGTATINVCDNQFYICVNKIGRHHCYANSSTITIPIHTLKLNSNRNHNFKLKDISNNYIYSIPSNTQIDLVEGTYFYFLENNANNAIEFTLDADKNITVNTYNLKLTATDKSGNPISSSYYLYKNGLHIASFTTDQNGIATTELAEPGDFEIRNTHQHVIGTVSITEYDTEYIITEENAITLKAIKNDTPYSGQIMFSKDMTSVMTVYFNNGTASVRLEEGDYFIYTTGPNLGYKKTPISDNSEIELAEITLSSKGNGLAFPCTFYDNIPLQIIKGQVIRFAAVPMNGYKCDYWEINGQRYYTDMIEYQISDNSTTAIAHFSAETTNNVQQTSMSTQNMEIQITDGILYFPELMEGEINIYNTAGILMKNIYIISSSLNVSDLASGVYILSLTDKEGNVDVLKFSIGY